MSGQDDETQKGTVVVTEEDENIRLVFDGDVNDSVVYTADNKLQQQDQLKNVKNAQGNTPRDNRLRALLNCHGGTLKFDSETYKINVKKEGEEQQRNEQEQLSRMQQQLQQQEEELKRREEQQQEQLSRRQQQLQQLEEELKRRDERQQEQLSRRQQQLQQQEEELKRSQEELKRQQQKEDQAITSVWESLVPGIIERRFPELQPRKRQRDVVQIEDGGDEGNARKRPKCWKADCMPAIVPPGSNNEWKWYQGNESSSLFIRECIVKCLDCIWQAYTASQAATPRPMAFIVSGPPGLGKSWSSNTVVWKLLQKRQSMWFHSASDHTLTMIKFVDDGPPSITERPEQDVHRYHPPKGTWFLYDSVGGSGNTQTMYPFEAQPPGVPCIIFSSPKDTNYKVGIKRMEGTPGGGKILHFWMPAWDWNELEEVMESLYIEAMGVVPRERETEKFRSFIRRLFQLWGGIPRRFNKYCDKFREQGEDAAVEASETEFTNELGTLANQLLTQGPFVVHEMLERVYPGAETEKSLAPPSWLVFPSPLATAKDPLQRRCYKFCSRRAEMDFFKHLEDRKADDVLEFCKRVFTLPGANGLAFERFAHFVLTRTENNEFRWKLYGSGNDCSKVVLPKCENRVCEMKTDFESFEKTIAACVEGGKCIVIDPKSDQQDAIDMVVVCKLEDHWCVLAMQDTIGNTHSFHPVKILEYKAAAEKALKKAGASPHDGWFRHVVVVREENPKSPFRLQVATMPKMSSLEAVKEKISKIGLSSEVDLQKWNVTKARQACNLAKVKDRTLLKGEQLKTAGAEVSLLQKAEAKVKELTWVLDGFFK